MDLYRIQKLLAAIMILSLITLLFPEIAEFGIKAYGVGFLMFIGISSVIQFLGSIPKSVHKEMEAILKQKTELPTITVKNIRLSGLSPWIRLIRLMILASALADATIRGINVFVGAAMAILIVTSHEIEFFVAKKLSKKSDLHLK